jgi:hypothetical protein
MAMQELAVTSGIANSTTIQTPVTTSTMIEHKEAANHTTTIHTCVTRKITVSMIPIAADVETATALVLVLVPVQALVKTSAGTTTTISVNVTIPTVAATTATAVLAKTLTARTQIQSKLKLLAVEAAATTTKAAQCTVKSFLHTSFAKHLVHSASKAVLGATITMAFG